MYKNYLDINNGSSVVGISLTGTYACQYAPNGTKYTRIIIKTNT